MKRKYDWFDDNWNLDIKLHTVILEFLLSPAYRCPRPVTEVHIYRNGNIYSQCPRCKGIIVIMVSGTNVG